MFIERLKISAGNLVIRDIAFHEGMNLIVDETASEDPRQTGNNVGKTTVLKLVDFCLGAKPDIIYTDPEDKSSKYELVERFLKERSVLITLTLAERINDIRSKRVTIERNFLQRNQAVRRVNGEQVRSKEFELTLARAILPELPAGGKPSFRQAITHNIRYEPSIMENTLKTLGPYGRNVEYEALNLFLLGIPHHGAREKQSLSARRTTEKNYLKRLLNGHSVSDYQTVLSQTDREIATLEKRRESLFVDDDYATKLDELDDVKMQVSRMAALVSQLDLRISVIEEAQRELLSGLSRIDLNRLASLYDEAKAFVPELHKKFEHLVEFHNTMIQERVGFVAQELPSLQKRRSASQRSMDRLIKRTKELSEELSLLPASEQIDEVIDELGQKMRLKGEYETRISQIEESERRIAKLDQDIAACEEDIYSPEHEALVRDKVALLNYRFSQVSQELYGETYMLGVDIKTDRNGTRYYDVHTVDLTNYSAGKKQGEVLAFDLAYVMYANDEDIDCLHFILNDRKELMHGNQLTSVDSLARRYGSQLVVSILQDKLPGSIDLESNVVLRLSTNDKLFRIEEILRKGA